MKSKIFIFTTLILVVFLFVITSCDNFLNAKNKTTININLDLSKILKTSRNETTTIPTEYILKVFAYNAATYKSEDEIQNLPLLTQTENKVDINGNVKASLDIAIGLNVIFVAKLYQGKSEKPLYAGKSEVIKIKATDNKVHLVLTRENADLDIDILIHDHTFATDWTSDATHHWHEATCEHTTEVSDKAEHSFGEYISNNDATTEADGTKTRECSVCGYKDTVTDDGSKIHVHIFAEEWSSDGVYHWKWSTCEHEVVSGKAEHSFGNWTVTKAATEEAEGTRESTCTVCEYKATEAIAKLAHTHKFATDWTKDETNHWYASTCGHTTEVSGKAAHSFNDWTVTKAATEEAEGTKERSCTICGYTATEVIEKLAHTHKFATDWTKDATNHWYASTCGHTTEVSGKAAHSFDDWTVTKAATEEAEGTRERSCTICGYTATEVIEKLDHTHIFATDWTSDATHHWHAATCEHTTEVSGKAAHSFGDWTTTKEATEEVEGTREKSCTVCGYKVTEVIAKLDHTHTFATDWTKDETNHWYASTCGHYVTDSKAAHSFVDWQVTKEASCTEEGEKKATCTTCGYEKTEITDKAEHSYKDGICVCGMREMVLIPAGTFQMGSIQGTSSNRPVHEVTITKPFYMGEYEVTQAEYEKYCSYTGSSAPSSSYGDGDNYPAYRVSWYDALVYCNKRSIAERLTPCYSINDSTNPDVWGTVPTSSDSEWNAVECDWNANGYRLPTEAEWEYAARAGDNTVDSLTYSGTSDVNELGKYAWYESNSNSVTHEVGTKLPNAFGLYDMSGNVWEWCWNWITDSYDTEAEGGSDPTGASAGSSRVLRGGCCSSLTGNFPVSVRSSYTPSKRYYDTGFRVVRSFPSTTE